MRELATRKFFMLGDDTADVDGAGVLVWYGTKHDLEEFSPEDTLKMVIYVFELALRTYDRVSIILYAPRGSPFDLKLIRSIVTVLGDNYPETLNKAIVFPIGSYTPVLFKMVKVFMDPKTANKVVLLPGNRDGSGRRRPPGLKEYLDPQKTPKVRLLKA